MLVHRQDGEGNHASYRGHERGCQRSGSDLRGRPAGTDQEGARIEPPPMP